MQRTAADIGYSAREETLARYAKALSHPVRIRILNFLEKQTCCFTGELTEEIPMAQSTISQHLKELKDAGLIQGDVMPPRIKYCINQKAWAEAKKMFAAFFE
ncbi:MAG: winged helix-turn-helix transcriptional regulator [Chitinophagaceae bacterium]|nr:winged helix-turn-helix transcriptional regulator [Chitinophagaceae bacterium]